MTLEPRIEPPARRALARPSLLVLATLASAVAACGTAAPPADGSSGDAHPDARAVDPDAGDGAMIVLDAPDAAPDAPPDARPDAPPDVPFVPGAHEPLPQVPDQGGTRLRHPHLVTITFADDARRPALEAFSQWIATSHWLTTVGAEYGIGAGVALDPVRRTENAPDNVDTFAIEDMLLTGFGDGSIPRPESSGDSTLYVIHYPSHSTVTMDSAQSCVEFAGYHFESNYAGTAFSYAVVIDCGGVGELSAVEQAEFSTSHEIIEAATDALPLSAPAYAMRRPTSETDVSPWLLIGGEVGDLCDLPQRFTREDGHVLQRVWSNAVAATGTADPCVPAAPDAVFYGTTASPNTLGVAAPGEVVHYTLRGFSDRPIADWRLSTQVQGSFTPTLTFGTRTMNNARTTTLDVTVPASAPPGSLARIYLFSQRSLTDYQVWPLGILVR